MTGTGYQALGLVLKTQGLQLLLVNVYFLPAPTLIRHATHCEDTMEAFFQAVSSWASPSIAGTLIMGDYNAHVAGVDMGPRDLDDVCLPADWTEPAVIPPGTCSQGYALGAHLGSLDMVGLTGRLPGDPGHWSFVGPQGHSRVDHILCGASLLHHVMDSGVLWDVVGSDHIPLYLHMFPSPPVIGQPTPSCNSLRWSHEHREAYCVALESQLSALDCSVTHTPDTVASHLQQAIRQAAYQVGLKPSAAPPKKRAHSAMWKRLYAKHVSVYRTQLQSLLASRNPDRFQLAAVARDMQRALRRVSRQHAAMTARHLLASLKCDPAYAWKLLRPKVVSPPVVQDMRRWYRGLRDRFTTSSSPLLGELGLGLGDSSHPLLLPFQLDEIQAALADLPASSSAGLDGIPPAFLKFSHCTPPDSQPSPLLPWLKVLFDGALQHGMPASWGVVSWSPLPKKAHEDPMEAYRLIALTDGMYRVMMKCLNVRLQIWLLAQGKVPHTQFGFFKGRNCAMPALALWDQIQHARHLPQDLYLAFVDVKAAYDCVDRAALWAMLHQLRIPTPLISCLQHLYAHNTGVLRVAGQGSVEVTIGRGLFQGCPLSPLLFNLLLSDLEPRLAQPPPASLLDPLYRLDMTHLGYADDICLMTDDPARLQLLLETLQSYLQTKGLSINTAKTKLMMVASTYGPPPCVTVSGGPLQWVDRFRYLGLLFDRSGDLRVMGRDRMLRGKSTLMAALSLLHKVHLRTSVDAMHLLLHTMVLPTLLYGSELWGHAFLSPSSAHWLDHFVGRAWKLFFHLPISTPTKALLHELHLPWPATTWVGQTLRFYDRVVNLPPLHPLRSLMASSLSTGWLRMVLHRLSGSPFQVYADIIQGTTVQDPLHLPSLSLSALKAIGRAHFTHMASWFCHDPRHLHCPHRKHASYFSWCFSATLPSPAHLPWSFSWKVLWLRLRLGALPFRVHRHVPFMDRSCPHCHQTVQDLRHVLWGCPSTAPPFLFHVPSNTPFGPLFWHAWISSPHPFFDALKALLHDLRDPLAHLL